MIVHLEFGEVEVELRHRPSFTHELYFDGARDWARAYQAENPGQSYSMQRSLRGVCDAIRIHAVIYPDEGRLHMAGISGSVTEAILAFRR